MNEFGGEADPLNHEVDPGVLSHLNTWISKQDARFSLEFNNLQDTTPDIFNSSLKILESIRDAAKLVGRKELLDELKYEFSQSEDRKQD